MTEETFDKMFFLKNIIFSLETYPTLFNYNKMLLSIFDDSGTFCNQIRLSYKDALRVCDFFIECKKELEERNINDGEEDE
jgi:hypothetical protein